MERFDPAPTGWRRRTIAVFVEPDEDKTNPANVVVVREPLAEGETVHAIAEKHLLDLREQPSFVARGYRTCAFDDAKAVLVECEWVNERGPIVQTTTVVEEAGMVTVTTWTCAKQDEAAMLPVFASFIAREWPIAPRTVSGIAPKPEDEPTLPELPMPGPRAAARGKR